jgi:multiple sugar transport system permease protein
MTFPFAWMVLTSLKHPTEVFDASQWVPKRRLFVSNEEFPGKFKDVEVDVLGPAAGPGKPDPGKPGSPGLRVRYKAGQRLDEEEVVDQERVRPRRLHFENYATAWGSGDQSFGRYITNSFVVALLTTIGQLVTSLLAAYAFVFFAFPLKEVLFSVLMITLMVPQQVLLVPDYLIISSLGWINSYLALIVPWTAGVFGIFLLRQFFLTLPKDLYEAALIDGCGRLGFLFRVLVPLSVPPLVTLAIFSFLGNWNALIWPLIVTNEARYYTVQVGLAQFATEAGTRWDLMMAASCISILPLVMLYFVAQRQFIEGIARTGIKG